MWRKQQCWDLRFSERAALTATRRQSTQEERQRRMDSFSEVMSSWGIEGKNKFVIYVAEKSDMMPRNQQDSWPRVESKHGHEVKYFRKRPLLCQSPSIYDILPCLVMMKISSIRHSEVLTIWFFKIKSARHAEVLWRYTYGGIRES